MLRCNWNLLPLPNNSSVPSSICVKHSSPKISSGKVFRLIVSKRWKLFDYGTDVTFAAIYLTSPIVLVFRLDTQTTILYTKCPFYFFERLPRPKNIITQYIDAACQTNAVVSMQRTAIQILSSYTLNLPVGSVNQKMWEEVQIKFWMYPHRNTRTSDDDITTFEWQRK